MRPRGLNPNLRKAKGRFVASSLDAVVHRLDHVSIHHFNWSCVGDEAHVTKRGVVSNVVGLA